MEKKKEKKMFRVYAESITDLYLDVEAETKEEAMQIAEETDGYYFVTCDSGDWNITSAYEITEEERAIIRE